MTPDAQIAASAAKKASVTHFAAVAYESMRPLIIWLGLTQLAWLVYWLVDPADSNPALLAIVGIWAFLMLIWMVAVSMAGIRGLFLKYSRWFSNLVGLQVVLLLSVVLFATLPSAREGLLWAARNTSDLQLVSIHVLRLLAVGTVIKYLQGQLPLHFVVFGSLPDFSFAASAVAVAIVAANGPLGGGFLVAWHVIGICAFLGAGVSMFFSVPSPLRIYHGKPDTSLVFQFPMLLAPNFTVPLFMLAHVMGLVKILVT